MDSRTLAALRGSIAKWQAIVAGTIEDEGRYNCPLCLRFFDDYCHGCPVRIDTDKLGCEGTPYEDYTASYEPAHQKKAAEAEVAYLISLLPEGELP